MSTLAQALSLAGNRQSGAPVRTQNGKFSDQNTAKYFIVKFSNVHHMFEDFIENDLNELS